MKFLEEVRVWSLASGSALWVLVALGCSSDPTPSSPQPYVAQGGATSVGSTAVTTGSGGSTGGVTAAAGSAVTTAGAGTTTGFGGASSVGSTTLGGSTTTVGMGGSSSGTTGSVVPSGNCVFTEAHQTADQAGQGGIPTVGIVNWSVDLANLTSASITFTLQGAQESLTAPVDLTQAPSFRTLLLGMKSSSTYDFQITVSDGASTCTSSPYSITTGTLPSSLPGVTRMPGPAAASQERGFIVTSSGVSNMNPQGGGDAYAFIIDADGDLVWWTSAPSQCSRAKMSHDGQHMYMLALNVQNMAANGGAVERVSMDGLSRETVQGLSNCHHDLTVTPSNTVVCASWTTQPGDQPSDLLEADSSGNVTTVMRLDANVYPGGRGLVGGTDTFHVNALHYYPEDDSFTFADRNPSMVVKVTRQGQPLWQVGGDCSNAPAAGCVGATWRVNHGHEILGDGSLLIFNNGEGGPATVLNYTLNETGAFSAMQTWTYNPGTQSNVLGDVQALPGGGMIVAFSTSGIIHETDASRELVQTISAGTVGYTNWRETLYGPPVRY